MKTPGHRMQLGSASHTWASRGVLVGVGLHLYAWVSSHVWISDTCLARGSLRQGCLLSAVSTLEYYSLCKRTAQGF